jgi:hypothetical protein
MRYLLGTTAVAAALLLSVPAFAQASPYDTNPTPAEKAQTEQLNNDAVTNGQTDDQDAQPSQNQRDYDANKAEYDRKMQDYNAQRGQYDNERARYHDERAEYAHNWAVFYGYQDFRVVDRMSSDELVGMRVSARDGVHIGRIRDVDTAPDGRIVRIGIRLDDGHGLAWIDSDDLRFNPADRNVMIDLSRSQVDDMAHMHAPRY